MSIQLVRIGVEEAENIWKMQIKAFYHLYEKYCDTETSPAKEELDKIIFGQMKN